MKKTGLLSNCLFIVQTAVRLNPTLLAARIPLVLVNAAQPFIPIVFLRLILNEITMDQDMRRILWYVLSMAAATLAAELISGALGAWSATLTETTLRRMRNRLGEAIMEMPFALVEEPRVRDFISLAKEEAKIFRDSGQPGFAGYLPADCDRSCFHYCYGPAADLFIGAGGGCGTPAGGLEES